MPVHITCHGKKCRVSTPNGVKAKGTTPEKAKRQAALIRAVDHGWTPTHEAVDEATELFAEALHLVAELIDERDDIGTLPLPASAKAYARLTGGIPALEKKQALYMKMNRDLSNPGKSLDGFKDYDATEGLEASYVEPTVIKQGKTRGKFQFPKNFKVGHAIKS